MARHGGGRSGKDPSVLTACRGSLNAKNVVAFRSRAAARFSSPTPLGAQRLYVDTFGTASLGVRPNAHAIREVFDPVPSGIPHAPHLP